MAKIIWHNERRAIRELIPYEVNPRQITDKQAKDLKASLAKFGIADPIIINTDNMIIGGHQRMKILETLLGYEPDFQIDVRVPDRELSIDEVRELNVRLNKNVAEWDFDTLANNFELDDLLDWGFDKGELDLDLWAGDAPEDVEPQIDKAEELREKWGVESGQLWRLGEHRLICGDCTDRAVVERVMGGEKADICLTDPPYGLGDKKASGKNDYDQHEDSRANLEKLAAAWLPIARDISTVVVFSPGVTNAWIYPEANWIMCWFYGGGQLRSSWGFNCWQPFLCYGKDPSLAHGHGGRPDAVDMNTPANADDLDHPCPKPLPLWEWFIGRLSFEVGEIFYDPFGGSGTTIVACERLGRKCRAVEISPAYCAVAIQRWVDMTGGTPELITS